MTQFRRDWVVSAEDVDGVGYNWNGIQRVKNHGKKVLYIRRLLVKPQHNMPLTCKCGDRMQCRASFCCIGCRVCTLVPCWLLQNVVTLPQIHTPDNLVCEISLFHAVFNLRIIETILVFCLGSQSLKGLDVGGWGVELEL